MATPTESVRRLPQLEEHWEIACTEVEHLVEGVDRTALTLTVEGSGRIRGALAMDPDGALTELLHQMFEAPLGGCAPGRPKRLVCSHPRLADQLRAALAKTPVKVVSGRTPVADHAMESMVQSLRPLSAPGVTRELPLWSAALDALCRLEPWRTIDDDHAFHLSGVAGLEGAVAVVLGRAGEQLGVVVYPDEAAQQRFLAVATGDGADFAGMHNLTLLLDPADTYEEHERAACRRSGLELPGGLLPRALALDDGQVRPLDAEQELRLLAAVEALVGACAFGVPALLKPCSRTARTVLGRVRVETRPEGFDPARAGQ